MEEIKYLYFKIIMEIDGEEYLYGRETNRNKANEIAMRVREERGCDVWVAGEVD